MGGKDDCKKITFVKYINIMPDLEPGSVNYNRNDIQLMDKIRILDALHLVDKIRESHPDQARAVSYISLSTMDQTQPKNRALVINLGDHKATLWEVVDSKENIKKLAEVSVPTVRALICVLEIGIGENYQGSKFLNQV